MMPWEGINQTHSLYKMRNSLSRAEWISHLSESDLRTELLFISLMDDTGVSLRAPQEVCNKHIHFIKTFYDFPDIKETTSCMSAWWISVRR